MGLAYPVMPRYADGSKSVIRYNSKTQQTYRVGTSQYLNERSARDLQRILTLLEKRKIRIHDIQFLIGHDGSVVLSDPQGIVPGKPSTANKLVIEALIKAAKEKRR